MLKQLQQVVDMPSLMFIYINPPGIEYYNTIPYYIIKAIDFWSPAFGPNQQNWNMFFFSCKHFKISKSPYLCVILVYALFDLQLKYPFVWNKLLLLSYVLGIIFPVKYY